MSESYPDLEHCAYIDIFSGPLPKVVMDQHDIIVDLEDRLHTAEMAVLRYDEGIEALQWFLSKLSRRGPASVKSETLERVYRELAIFGRTGRTPEWIEDGRREIGR